MSTHGDRSFSDEQVMAYVDGELDAAEARRLRSALLDDAELAQRVESERALRARIGRAYASDLDEPVPERLRALLPEVGPVAPGTAAGSTVDLDAARAARRGHAFPPSRWAMAACLVGGIALGWLARPALDVEQGAVVARGPLEQALERQTGDVVAGPIRIPLTVRTDEGSYCRAFVAPEGAGLACRSDDGWRVRQLTPVTPAGEDGLRMAASPLPSTVLDAIDAVAAGPSLDVAGERDAMARGWTRR